MALKKIGNFIIALNEVLGQSNLYSLYKAYNDST